MAPACPSGSPGAAKNAPGGEAHADRQRTEKKRTRLATSMSEDAKRAQPGSAAASHVMPSLAIVMRVIAAS
jgi:hypothetical protein